MRGWNRLLSIYEAFKILCRIIGTKKNDRNFYEPNNSEQNKVFLCTGHDWGSSILQSEFLLPESLSFGIGFWSVTKKLGKSK